MKKPSKFPYVTLCVSLAAGVATYFAAPLLYSPIALSPLSHMTVQEYGIRTSLGFACLTVIAVAVTLVVYQEIRQDKLPR